MVDQFWCHSALALSCRLEVGHGPMAVEKIMCLRLLGGLFDDPERVSVHLNVRLKLELEATFILAKDRDRPLILSLVRLCRIPIDIAVGNAVVSGLARLAHPIWHEEELVGAQEELSKILCLLYLTHVKSIHGLLLGLILESRKPELLPASIVYLGGNLGRVHLLKAAVRGSSPS